MKNKKEVSFDHEVTMSQNSYWIYAISLVRYALWRMTSVVNDTCDEIRAHRKDLMQWQLRQIRQEIWKEITYAEAVNKTVGAKCDHNDWKQLVSDMDEWEECKDQILESHTLYKEKNEKPCCEVIQTLLNKAEEGQKNGRL